MVVLIFWIYNYVETKIRNHNTDKFDSSAGRSLGCVWHWNVFKVLYKYYGFPKYRGFENVEVFGNVKHFSFTDRGLSSTIAFF